MDLTVKGSTLFFSKLKALARHSKCGSRWQSLSFLKNVHFLWVKEIQEISLQMFQELNMKIKPGHKRCFHTGLQVVWGGAWGGQEGKWERKMEDGDFELLVFTYKSESGPADFIFACLCSLVLTFFWRWNFSQGEPTHCRWYWLNSESESKLIEHKLSLKPKSKNEWLGKRPEMKIIKFNYQFSCREVLRVVDKLPQFPPSENEDNVSPSHQVCEPQVQPEIYLEITQMVQWIWNEMLASNIP